jgi:hypothetical protein
MSEEKKLLVCCPTRIRPHRIREMVRSFEETKRHPGTQLALYLGHEDPRLPEYQDTFQRGHHIIIGKRHMFGPAINRLFYCFPDFEFYSPGNDDFVYRTPGWDVALMEAVNKMPGGVGIANSDSVHTRHNYPEHRHPCGCAISVAIPRALGHVYWPKLSNYRTDTYLRDLAEGIGSTPETHYAYLPEVIIEHVHVNSGGDMDANYSEQYTHENMAANDAVFNQWASEHKGREIEAIRRSFQIAEIAG